MLKSSVDNSVTGNEMIACCQALKRSEESEQLHSDR